MTLVRLVGGPGLGRSVAGGHGVY